MTSDEKREGLCELCDREYQPWSAASPLWNAVVRGGSINGEEEFAYLCADCFMRLAANRRVATGFQLDAAVSLIALETVTPSGRRWNAGTFRYEPEVNGK
jgi:hypothetical protein